MSAPGGSEGHATGGAVRLSSQGAMAVSPADAAQLALWRQAFARAPSELPAGLEPVQRRLVRAVARGELPDLGPVYVKVMAFPRARDRRRYWVRALPAVHEARMLARAAAAGLRCPQVVAAWGERDALGRPRACGLITRALAATGELPTLAEAASVAARLAAAGIHHPDLNRGNLLRTHGGGVAVLDLQSARARRAPLRRRHRLAMAAKLLAEPWDCGTPHHQLVTAGLLEERELAAASHRAARLWRRFAAGRVWRCLAESTEFTRRRSWWCTWHARRGVPASVAADAALVPGGRELFACWVGDRVLQLAGEPPHVVALRRPAWWLRWLPGVHALRLAHGTTAHAFAAARPRLLAAYARFRGGEPPEEGLRRAALASPLHDSTRRA